MTTIIDRDFDELALINLDQGNLVIAPKQVDISPISGQSYYKF